MAMSHDISASPVPTYFIYRDVPEGQLYDPTATLAFFPPKDSDELFDALRAKFPLLKSHSERMRDATIEFLMQEREAEALSADVSPAMPSLYDSMNDTSPWQQSWPSASMTTLSSPEMTNFTTPVFGNSPKPQIPHLARQQSSAATSNEGQTPAIDHMTSVFSLSTNEQPKQRVRRKMTEAEKVEYRKRRIVKACDKCSKRKRKCVHNQPEIEGLKSVNDKAAHKVAKPRHNSGKQPQHADASFSFDLNATDPVETFTGDGFVGGYEDFTLMFDDPALDFNVDDFMSFDPLNSNTKPDNYRQCVQHFNADLGELPCTPRGSYNLSPLVSSGSDSFSSHAHSIESADNVGGLMFPHSSQMFDDPHSRLGYPPQQQYYSPQADIERSSSADHLEAYGPSCKPGGQDLPAQLAQPMRTWQIPSNSARFSRGRSGEETPAEVDRITRDVLSLPELSGSEQVLQDTALRRSRSAAVNDASVEIPSPGHERTDLLRHRLRRASVRQSELSSTSVTSSSKNPEPSDTATLEGRPTDLGGTPVSPRSSPHGATTSEENASRTATTALAQSSRRWLSRGESTPPLSSPNVESSATQIFAPRPTLQTRADAALLAHASPFSRADGTHGRSTELFRLKHRIPVSLDAPVPFAARATPATGLSTQANGGAYPRPDATTTATTQRNSAQATQQQNQDRTIKTPSAAKSTAAELSAARMLFTESDTRRYRDHHGRLSSAAQAVPSAPFTRTTLCIALAVLTLAVTVMAMSTTTSMQMLPSVLILAVLAPALAANASKDQTAMSHLQRTLTSNCGKNAGDAFAPAITRQLLCLA